MKRTKVLFLLIYAWVTTPSVSRAERTVFLPSYIRRVGMSWPAGCCAPGQKIGFMTQFVLRINNISSVTQTGTLRFQPGTYALANQPNGTGGLRSPTFDVKYLICTVGGTSTSSGFAPGPGNPTGVSTATWSVPPNSSVQMMMAAVFQSTYSANPAGPGHNGGDSVFEPVGKLTVNEDRGAITATLITMVEGLGSMTLCDGSTVTQVAPIYVNYGTEIPVLVNAGRPF